MTSAVGNIAEPGTGQADLHPGPPSDPWAQPSGGGESGTIIRSDRRRLLFLAMTILAFAVFAGHSTVTTMAGLSPTAPSDVRLSTVVWATTTATSVAVLTIAVSAMLAAWRNRGGRHASRIAGLVAALNVSFGAGGALAVWIATADAGPAVRIVVVPMLVALIVDFGRRDADQYRASAPPAPAPAAAPSAISGDKHDHR